MLHKFGLVVGKFAPPHLGHDLLIQTALEGCQHLILLVYSNPDFDLMRSRVRAEWLGTLYPNAQIYLPENPPSNDADDFTQREFVRCWLEGQGLKVDVVFTSESYGPGFAEHLGVPHVLVDLERLKFPVSGTEVRAQLERLRQNCTLQLEPEGRWNWPESERLPLRPEIQTKVLRWLEPVHRVVFLGAESTGKSTLTRRMAQRYSTLAVAEYGREVWEHKGGVLEPDDYTEIARRHLALEDAATLELSARARNSSPQYLFCDTNALTTCTLRITTTARQHQNCGIWPLEFNTATITFLCATTTFPLSRTAHETAN